MPELKTDKQRAKALKEVWKFFINTDRGGIAMPAGSDVLHIGSQDGRVVIWALVDPAAPQVTRAFRIFVTGEPIESLRGMIYRGTTQAGPYVWHVFEYV